MNRRRFLGSTLLAASLRGGSRLEGRPQKVTTGDGAVRFSDFDRQAFAALPIERRYDFAKALREGGEWPACDLTARPTAEETAIPPRGWSLLIPSRAGIVLRQAAEEFRTYLEKAMHTRVAIQPRDSLADWRAVKGVVVAGTPRDLPGCGAHLSGPKDYQIIASSQSVVACGFDEQGAMHGLYNLEARMSLREGPILPVDLNTVRCSLYKARMTLSGLGWMEWPDRYLALLARYGFDSIFASVYCNPHGVPGPPPYWDHMRSQDPERVHDVIRRAAQFGIRVYCPIIYRYTGEPDNAAGLRKLVRDMVQAFPEIRGYILLTEGFFYKTWFGAGGQKSDLFDWIKHWGEGVGVVIEECQKINPAIEVLPWDYNIDFRPDKVEVKKYVIEQLPKDAIPLITFENGKAFSLDGEHGYLADYSINQVGPSEVSAAQIAEAKRRGMRAVYAKADTSASWQLGTFPYLPFPQQWYDRYRALEKYRIDGTMESWSYGFQPSFVGELRCWYSWTDAPPLDSLLRSVARRDFGPGSEDSALKAWDHFSNAIRLFPATGGRTEGCNAVAAPFFLQKPEPRAMTLRHSWTDEKTWERESGIDPAWPYTATGFVLFPDFTNQVNVAQRHARPFTLPVFNKYLIRAAEEMDKGLESYRAAGARAPEAKRKNALRQVLLAEQIERMMRSAAALLEFEDLRFRLAHTQDSTERARILDRMGAILAEEIARTEAALETSRRDSRLGYEWERDYVYTPAIIEEKLKLLRVTLTEQLPACRREGFKHRLGSADESAPPIHPLPPGGEG